MSTLEGLAGSNNAPQWLCSGPFGDESMKFSEPILDGLFLKRYKRFFADVHLDGKRGAVVAHVPNTGSLLGCLEQNAPCRVSFHDVPDRKLKYTLQMIKTPTSWVGVNTGLSNDLVWEAYSSGQIKSWEDWDYGQREVKISPVSRVDLVLWKNHPDAPSPAQRLTMSEFVFNKFHFVEVKNVTLARDGRASFPDAETERGQKHLLELMTLLKQGHTAELVFTVQRDDCHSFAPADDIDPKYGKLLREAVQLGLIISPYACRLDRSGIELNAESKLKVDLS